MYIQIRFIWFLLHLVKFLQDLEDFLSLCRETITYISVTFKNRRVVNKVLDNVKSVEEQF